MGWYYSKRRNLKSLTWVPRTCKVYFKFSLYPFMDSNLSISLVPNHPCLLVCHLFDACFSPINGLQMPWHSHYRSNLSLPANHSWNVGTVIKAYTWTEIFCMILYLDRNIIQDQIILYSDRNILQKQVILHLENNILLHCCTFQCDRKIHSTRLLHF